MWNVSKTLPSQTNIDKKETFEEAVNLVSE